MSRILLLFVLSMGLFVGCGSDTPKFEEAKNKLPPTQAAGTGTGGNTSPAVEMKD